MPCSKIGHRNVIDDGNVIDGGNGNVVIRSHDILPTSLVIGGSSGSGYQGYYILPDESTKKVRVCPWTARDTAGYSREKGVFTRKPLYFPAPFRALKSMSKVVSF